ncbi:MAG TPA: hypothetical protein VHR42_06310, partial [Clostridia bacterium]|nr:hypothetical protein [Clostridia bacterium]
LHKWLSVENLDLEQKVFSKINKEDTPILWFGGLSSIVDKSNNMPAKIQSEFHEKSQIYLAGRLSGSTGQEKLQANWHFPNGTIKTDDFTLNGNKSYCKNYSTSEIGDGLGEVSIIMKETGKVLVVYPFSIIK